MDRYIATFHTHLSAILTSRALEKQGVAARMAPAPRKLSSSCGTCVFYEAGAPCLEQMDADTEAVYLVEADEQYSCVYRSE